MERSLASSPPLRPPSAVARPCAETQSFARVAPANTAIGAVIRPGPPDRAYRPIDHLAHRFIGLFEGKDQELLGGESTLRMGEQTAQ